MLEGLGAVFMSVSTPICWLRISTRRDRMRSITRWIIPMYSKNYETKWFMIPGVIHDTAYFRLLRDRDRTFPDYNEYLSTWVEYKNFLWWVEFEYNDSWYSNSTHERGHSTHETWVKLEYNLFFQTSLTLNIDKIPRNLCGPHLHTQIHAYLATNLNKWETV